MHARALPALRSPGTPAAVALVLAAVLAIAGCGVTDDIAIPRPAAAPAVTSVPGSPATASAAAASPAAGVATCGPGLWSAIKDHIENPAVALVGIVGGCSQASIETTLDSSSVSSAIAICNKAAEVAYANGVDSITVTAADASRLATGSTGSSCIGEP